MSIPNCVEPDGVKQSVLRARRMIAASQGILFAILGAYFLIALPLVMAATEYKSDAHLVALGTAIFGAVFLELIVLLRWLPKMRLAAGAAATGKAELTPQTMKSNKSGFMAGLTIALVAGMLTFLNEMQGPQQRVRLNPEWMYAVATISAAVLFVCRFVMLRLWEDLLLIGSAIALGILLTVWHARFEVALMVPALAALIAGSLLYLRWRKWVRSLPHNGSMTEALQ